LERLDLQFGWKDNQTHHWCTAEMNINLDLNPADFQLCDGFGFYKFCSTGFGFHNLVSNFFATVSSVTETIDHCI